MRVLHVVHDFLPRHRAGAELYVLALTRALAASGVEVQVLCAEHDPQAEDLELRWREVAGAAGEPRTAIPVVEMVNRWRFRDLAESCRSPAIAETLDHVLRMTAPDVVHVHSLLNLSHELPALARARGIPSVATLHDYTLVCAAGGQMLSLADGAVCTTIDPERCRVCAPRSPVVLPMRLARSPLPVRAAASAAGLLGRAVPSLGRVLRRHAASLPAPPPLDAREITARLDAAREVFATVAGFVAPSHDLGATFVRLGLPREKLAISPYGHAPWDPAPHLPRAPGAPLRLGFVGTPVPHKGAHVLLEALRTLPPGTAEVVVHGDLGIFPAYADRLRTLARRLPVRFAGPFSDAGRAAAYAALDALVVPSLWPENAPLVVEEAFRAGLPVVASRIGGLPERVRPERCGLLFAPGDAADLAAAIARLAGEPRLCERLAAGVPPVRPIEDDALAWRRRYARVLAGRRWETEGALGEPPPATAGGAAPAAERPGAPTGLAQP